MPLPADYVTSRGLNVRGHNLRFSALFKQAWTNPAAVDADGYKTTFAGPNATTFEFTPASGLNGALVSIGRAVPDFHRNVVVTVTHATAVVAESGVIEGLDANGDFISEAWSVTAGGTSKVFTGAKSFAAVTKVTVTAATDASANSNTIGTGQVFGLDARLSVASAVKERVDGAIVTTGTLVVAGTGTADPRGTYSPATAPDGVHDYEVWVISDDPEAG